MINRSYCSVQALCNFTAPLSSCGVDSISDSHILHLVLGNCVFSFISCESGWEEWLSVILIDGLY